VTFVIQQSFSLSTISERRLFPMQFLRHRTMLLLYLGTAGASTGLGIAVYYVPLFFQFANGDSAIKAAIRLLSFVCVFVSVVMLVGGTLPLIGRYNSCTLARERLFWLVEV